MASTSQSIRFLGPASSAGPSGGSFDALNRILSDLCTRGSPKEGATLALRKHLEEQARDLNGEAFSRFMDQLYDRISSLLHSNDVAENLGALRAVNELIDVALGENASKVSKFASYMRHVFEVKQDPEVLALASRVLGHLARAGGAMTADEVEIQVRMALDWLQNDKAEHRLFAAVLILKEMAENASTVFNVHVPRFVDAIWVALRHPTLQVRERAVEALRACLKVIEKRETRWRVQWYYRMFEATQDGLGKNAPVHSIHGSLLAVGELLRNTGEFMMSRYREVAEIVLRYLEHRDRLVRLSITSLLPRIAHFLRDRFVTNYLTICMNHILAVLRQPAERGSGFIALGEMAGALDGELVHYLPTIMSHLRDAIAPRRGRPSMEALACVGNIAKAMGPSLEPHVRNLLDVMFSAGLSSTLVESLQQITDSIPSLLPTIQDRLLDSISVVLSKSHYAQARQVVPVGRGGTTNAAQQISDLSGPALVQLALQTLARFNFKGHELLEFARESVIVYLDDEDGATRKDAALCCCKLVANSFSSMGSAQFGSSRSNRSGGKRRRHIEELVEKLLIAAVADADVNVRHSIFSSLYENRGFDDFLAQADCLSAVFAALNDEALVARLLEGAGPNANSGIISGVLVTVGDLARVGGFAMRQYISELMPLIVDALLDGASAAKREVAVVTLGQVVQSTGYVITPYNEYPQLLGLLLKLLNGELVWSTRREVLKVLGIMGALDPHVHKRNQQSSPGSHGEVARAASESGQHIPSLDELPMDLWPSFATSEDYHSTVAVNSLMRILRDPSLASYHQKVVGSLMFIFKVLPDLFHTVRTCDDSLKDFITWKLGTLVSIVRQHIRKYLPELLSLISELWSSFGLPATNRPSRGFPVLHLVEQLCLALNDEFRKHLPVILPCCIQVLSDAERCNDYTYVLDILHTLEVFGGTLDEHMHLLFPALIRLFKVDAPVDIRRAAIKTLTRLIPRVQVTGHISSLVHHLKLVLDGKNDELRKDAVDALCCLAHALGEDFTIFIPSLHKLLLKHRLRHKEFDDIEGRLRRREPLISGSTAQRLGWHSTVEVISDPLNDTDNDPYEDGTDVQRQLRGHQVNDGRLRTAGEASQRSTKEDWAEWMRHFSIELLKESPSPALRTCARLAQLQPFVGRELFAAGFVSCWAQLNEASQKQLVRSLEMAFSSPNIPPEILATLLNLCRAFAKALHYKEMVFEGARTKKMDANPVAVVEDLIHINNQLHQHEAAVGILTYAQQHLGVQLKESWYEKLQRWDDALRAYTVKASQASSPHLVLEATLGRMRCLAALARWEELNNLCKEYWTPAEPSARLEMAPMAANAAWNMGEWDQMAEYVSRLDDGDETKLRVLGNTAASGDGSSNGTFFRAVLLVRRGKHDEAREYVERARKCLATELAALVLESYERAYSNMVRVQQLSELEEVIDYCTLPVGNPVAERRRDLIRNMWTERIKGAKRNVEVWQVLLAVRALVLPPTEDVDTWLKFASLCRKNNRISQAKSTLVKLLQSLAIELSSAQSVASVGSLSTTSGYAPLLARVYLRLGSWQWALSPGLDDESIQEILDAFRNATQYATKWGKAWHTWALFNTAVMSHYTVRGYPDVASQFVVAAVNGYFYSIACAANAKGVDDSLQALMYPLLVACKSISNLRRAAAQEVVDKVRQHSGVLVDQAQLVSKELIRVAILWQEMWHEGLEEASRLFFGEHNIEGMLKVLEPLHEMLEEGVMREKTTIKERAFIEAYRHELVEAWDCCMNYKRTLKEAELTQSASPDLVQCRDLELAVPGTYQADAPVVTIASFAPQLAIIQSKQRPRKLTILGSDGKDYAFLLKGHEDLRQDERVMQITLNQEHKYMLSFAPDYDHLPLIAKVEVFEYALSNTEGNDLARVLWLKSRTSEVWLERRTNYTRSLAVMSMVGYLLGLGDRHPSNLMLHRYSGKILHIDFGDCFEASMNREKFPEKVPFRLTRMLVKAMEVSGIEGTFRNTCENVMQVLRTNKDSVMAMMEAFVHDPLINWRLFNFNEVPQMSTAANSHAPAVVNSEESAPNKEQLPQPQRGARERELLQAVNQLGDANEVLNERAVIVMARMSNKLTGRDFSSSSASASPMQPVVDHSSLLAGDAREVDHGLSVKLQVQKLILQAMSHENLCQNYVGWCPF
ncbi:Serine/threonine-protein kinase TOR [Linum grandiflorum]